MKVLIINAHIIDSLGGSEMQCDLIAKGLIMKGHDVIYASVGKFRLDSYPMVDYKVIPLNLGNKKEVYRFVEQHLPEIIYWRFNRKQMKNIVWAKERLSIPMVFAVSSVHDSIPISAKGYSKVLDLKGYLKTILRFFHSYQSLQLIKKIEAITVLNSQLIYKLPVKRQKTIWNAVTLEIKDFEWRRPYVIWVANLKQVKRPEVYLELVERMGKLAEGLDFLMVGDIQEPIPYKRLVHEAGKVTNFHYLGKQSPEQVNGMLKNAVCLVHTCEPEGFGNNFIQAWLQACPTITLDHDPDGLINKHDIGFTSITIEQMTLDVLNLYEDNELRNDKGERARAFAEQHFTPIALTNRIEAFLEDVINSNE